MDKPVIILGAKGIAHPALEIFNSNQVIFVNTHLSYFNKRVVKYIFICIIN